MRVEIVAEIASLKDRLLGRGEPFEKASESQVLANFRSAVSGKDSFFWLQDCVAGFTGQSDEVHGGYAGQFMIAFRRLDLSSDRNLYFLLLQTLQELLKEISSSDALFATMCLTAPATEKTQAREPHLVLQLEAIGSTPEQAEVRWSLGLVQIQEALLSASRLLRHHLEKTGV
jgi:hypothetical protein